MKRLKRWILLTLLTVAAAAGCTATSDTTFEPTATSEATSLPPQTDESIRLTPVATPAVETVPTTGSTPIVGEVPEAIMMAVFQDLTTTTSLAREAFTVVQAEAVVWPDGALGCPQPGDVYTQAPVEGYRIVLEANGRTYHYHAAENGYVILCENSLPQPPAVGTPIS